MSPTRRRRGPARAAWGTGSLLALSGFALVYLGVTLAWGTPLWLALVYAGMSLVCAVAYGRDKAAAQQGQWRVAESTLLMLGLLGGWPGALLAQHILRHKTSKRSFQAVFWLTVVLNVGVFVMATTPWRALFKA